MPFLTVQQYRVDVPRRSVIVDSCVLVNAFDPAEAPHAHARDFVNSAALLIVPYVVISETWGVLVGRHKRQGAGVEMLKWLVSAPNVELVPAWREILELSTDSSERLEVDFVDAFLMNFATYLTEKVFCDGDHGKARIATYDTRDFFKSYKLHRFDVVDLRDGMESA